VQRVGVVLKHQLITSVIAPDAGNSRQVNSVSCDSLHGEVLSRLPIFVYERLLDCLKVGEAKRSDDFIYQLLIVECNDRCALRTSDLGTPLSTLSQEAPTVDRLAYVKPRARSHTNVTRRGVGHIFTRRNILGQDRP
jgi:hypothetical protein